MKKITAFILAASLAVSTASAGTLSDPIITEVEEPAPASSAPWVPIVALVGVGLLIYLLNDDDDAPVLQASDMRLKRNIQRVGTTDAGIATYTYSYLWSNKVYEGVMAQEVMKTHPEAVNTHLFGVMSVNYDMLGVDFKQIH